MHCQQAHTCTNCWRAIRFWKVLTLVAKIKIRTVMISPTKTSEGERTYKCGRGEGEGYFVLRFLNTLFIWIKIKFLWWILFKGTSNSTLVGALKIFMEV